MIDFNGNHFLEFSKSLHEKHQWNGYKIEGWYNYVSNKLKDLPVIDFKYKNNIARNELKELCKKDSGINDLECLISVMAWGGQNRKHGINLLKHRCKIEPIIREMRKGNLSHIDAYQEFYDIWKRVDNLGMGAAYFTKLIFFCEPSHKGYIMDQWTSKSINLLSISDKPIVHLTSGYVNKKNTSKNYSAFCLAIDEIAEYLNKENKDIKGEDVEMSLFSKGGYTKALWRKHVLLESVK